MSTNKVYGDAPNSIALTRAATRWDYADPAYEHGIAETFTIDQSKHSLFGASKVAADVMVQEYGRYFGLPTCALRGGCLTGPNHTGVELHGFLSLPREVQPRGPRVPGFRLQGQAGARQHPLARRRPLHGRVRRRAAGRRGVQPRRRQGQLLLHPRGLRDRGKVLRAGSRCTPTSTRTAPATTSATTRDLRKMRAHYPAWDITQSLEETIRQIVEAWRKRSS
jgi:CDP-paratose 2-epimerase